ncbi:MAG: SufS family cysteine desulfurase [Fimbriimonadaceae bacterium]|nr:SufS family cysteine desulfurase [Fimbriimonadaceae bacterium]
MIEDRALDRVWLAGVRSQFPALAQTMNGHPLAYLDNAATTQKPEAVIAAVSDYYRSANANVNRGVHTLGQAATVAYEASRATVGRWIGAAAPEEIVFTKGCTEAVNLVAATWGRRNLGKGDVVLLSHAEHHANIVPWQMAADATGAQVQPVAVDEDGLLDLEDLRRHLIEGSVRLLGLKHVCNALGTVQPVAEAVRLAHEHDALVLLDCAQALAHLAMDVHEIGTDFCTMSAHKAYGPMGIGALYGRFELLDALPPYQGGGDMIRSVRFEKSTYADLPNRLEPGTPHVAGAVGFAKALDWLGGIGVEEADKHERRLATLATAGLGEIPGVRIVGKSKVKVGIVSFVADWAHPHDLGTVLDQHGVAVRVGHHCCMPLMERLAVPATVRASFACYNNEGDVDALLAGVAAAHRIFG